MGPTVRMGQKLLPGLKTEGSDNLLPDFWENSLTTHQHHQIFFFSRAFSALSYELNQLLSPPENSGFLFACVPHPEPTLGDDP